MNLSSNQLSTIEGLSTLTGLELLWLNDNSIRRADGLESLTNLRVLWLCRNRVTEIGPALMHNQRLEELNLAHNRISSFRDILNLARLGSLKGGADDVKRHGFFKKIVWHSLLLKKIDAPYKPAIGSDTDASNFESFEDPDKGRPIQRNNFPRATFDEFSRLTASYTTGR